MFRIPVQEWGYGFFPGGDPRLFTPDGDATSEELENHRLACEAWDMGAQNSEADCIHGGGFILTRCQFGLGSYTYTDYVTPWEWLRWVAFPQACGVLWRWWEWDFKPAALRVWRGEDA